MLEYDVKKRGNSSRDSSLEETHLPTDHLSATGIIVQQLKEPRHADTTRKYSDMNLLESSF